MKRERKHSPRHGVTVASERFVSSRTSYHQITQGGFSCLSFSNGHGLFPELHSFATCNVFALWTVNHTRALSSAKDSLLTSGIFQAKSWSSQHILRDLLWTWVRNLGSSCIAERPRFMEKDTFLRMSAFSTAGRIIITDEEHKPSSAAARKAKQLFSIETHHNSTFFFFFACLVNG